MHDSRRALCVEFNSHVLDRRFPGIENRHFRQDRLCEGLCLGKDQSLQGLDKV